MSTHVWPGRARAMVAALAVLALAGACSADPEVEPVPTPKGFDLPSGVVLTRPGTDLDLGAPGTAVVDLGDGAASAVTVVVRSVRRGSIEDFRFFSLDAQSRAATPYYVDVTVRNDGPAGLGGSSLPVLAHSDADVVYPASELVGRFEPCPSATLPGRFLPGSSARLCFIYLVPPDEKVVTIDLQPGDPAAAVRWKPSK